MTVIRTHEHEVEMSPLHHIPGLPGWHPCSRPHGHSLTVTLVLEADIAEGEAGAVVAGDGLDDVDAWARGLSGRYLNELMPAEMVPTEENVACWIHDTWIARYPQLAAVRVASWPDTQVEYRPGGARPRHHLVDEARRMLVPIGWDGKPIYPDDDGVAGVEASAAG